MNSKTPGTSGRGEVRVKIKKNKGLKSSSRQWLARQLNDPYVHAAKAKGYRSRAAFKLVELDAKFHFLKKNARILDLGAAPGGWSQVAANIGAIVVGADVLAMEEIPGVIFFQADLTDPGTPALLKEALGGPADVVLSDMAAPTTGHRETDHIRTTALVEIALEVAEDTLKPGGVFVAKVFQGGATGTLLARIKRSFREVKHVKPPASRSDSVELYMVALGFKATGSAGKIDPSHDASATDGSISDLNARGLGRAPGKSEKQKAPAGERRSFRKR